MQSIETQERKARREREEAIKQKIESLMLAFVHSAANQLDKRCGAEIGTIWEAGQCSWWFVYDEARVISVNLNHPKGEYSYPPKEGFGLPHDIVHGHLEMFTQGLRKNFPQIAEAMREHAVTLYS